MRQPLPLILVLAAVLSGPATVGAYVVTVRQFADRDASAARADIALARDVSPAQQAATAVAEATAWRAQAGAKALLGRLRAQPALPSVDFNERRVVLEAGDTMLSMLQQWATSPEELSRLNPGLDPTRLEAGASIVVWRAEPDRPSASVGTPSRGRLENGYPMPASDAWTVRRAAMSWGTESTVRAIAEGYLHVAEAHPGGGTPLIADLSRRRGGYAPPHRSHRSGRDVDATYYRLDPTLTGTWSHVTAATMDVERQWALFAYWIEREQVDFIFVSPSISRALEVHARSIGVPEATLARTFGTGLYDGIIRHERGHADHYHARFRCADGDERCRNR